MFEQIENIDCPLKSVLTSKRKKKQKLKFSLQGTVSICTLATLSIHRLMSVMNVHHGKVGSYGRALAVVVFIWIYTFAISIPPFFGFGAYVPETSGMS